MVVNPGAWSHYAWSIHDALEPLEVPVVEVGQGPDGYRLALQYLKENA